MLEVSLLHIATVKRMVKAVNDPSVTKLVDDVEVKIKATYGGMSLGQQYMLRQTLQRFFLDKRVKVSLFLQEGIQSASGRLILPSAVGPKVRATPSPLPPFLLREHPPPLKTPLHRLISYFF